MIAPILPSSLFPLLVSLEPLLPFLEPLLLAEAPPLKLKLFSLTLESLIPLQKSSTMPALELTLLAETLKLELPSLLVLQVLLILAVFAMVLTEIWMVVEFVMVMFKEYCYIDCE